MGEKRTVTGAQFTMLLVVSYLTAGIFTFPREVVREAGPAALWSILLMAAIAYGGAMLVAWVGSHFPGMTGVQWGDAIIPYRIHRGLTVLAAGAHVVMAPAVARQFGVLLRETFFQVTPTYVLMTGLMVVAAYGASQGVEVLARVAIITSPVLIVTLVIAYVLIFPHAELYRVRPAPPVFDEMLRGAFQAVLLYEGIAALFLLQAHLNRPERVFRYVTYSFVISLAVFILIYVTTLSTFGIGGVSVLSWPAPQLLLLVRLRGWFTERLGLFVLIAWAGLMLLYIAVHLWAVGLATEQVLGLKPKAFRWIIVVLTGVFLAISLLSPDIEHVRTIFQYLPWGGLYVNVGLGLIQYIVGLFRGSFKKSQSTGAG